MICLFLPACTVKKVESTPKPIENIKPETVKKHETGKTESSQKRHSRVAEDLKITVYYDGEYKGDINPEKLDGLEEISFRAYRPFRGYRLSDVIKTFGITKASEVEVTGEGKKTGQEIQVLNWKDITDKNNNLALAYQSKGTLKLVGEKMISGRDEQVQDVIKIIVKP